MDFASKTSDSTKKTLTTNDLDLETEKYLDIPDNVVFPNELNQYLKQQLQFHMHQNGLLKKNLSLTEIKLSESQYKIVDLTKSLKEYETLCGKNEFVSSSAVASTKIVELSKKLREKCSELEALKTKCSKLEHTVFELQEEAEYKEMEETKYEKPETPQNEMERQIRNLQEKLSGAKSKLLEAKNSNMQLKNDLKLANKWLQQETGENFENMSMLHNNGTSHWRGRAQIICDLQNKNAELREKLKNLQEKGCTETPANNIKQDKRLESLTAENTDLKAALEDTKKKLDIARARAKSLDSEVLVLKNKISKFHEQIDANNREINNLNSQVSIEQGLKKDIAKQRDSQIKKLHDEIAELKTELEKRQCIVDNLTRQLEEKNEEIEEMRSRVRNSRPPSSYGNRQHSTANTGVKNDDQISVSRLQAEKIRLLELTEVQSKRLETERDAHHKTETELRYERQRAAKLESALARAELEHHSPKSGSYASLSSFSKNSSNNSVDNAACLQDKLELAEENIRALRTRLQIEKHERKMDLQQFANILQNYTSKSEADITRF